MSRRTPWPGLLAALALALAVVLPAVAIAWKSSRDPSIAWLPGDGPSRWIVYPVPPDMRARPLSEMGAVFRRTFTVDALPPRARLLVRTFRHGEVVLNGQRLPLDEPGPDWKRARTVDATPFLRAGANQISVLVRNDAGPPALWLRIEGPGLDLTTGPGWEASLAGAAWMPVRIASDPPSANRVDPAGILVSPLHGLRERWPLLLAIAVGSWLAALILWLATRWRPARSERLAVLLSPVSLALLGVTAAWVALFVNNAPVLPLQIGFDAVQHLEYVRYVLERHAIPLADEGWQMFQPPLYYVLSALGLAASGATTSSPGGALVIRAVGFGSALAIVVSTFLLLRHRFRASPLAQAGGVLFAAFLPPVLYLSHFPTNELLAAALATASLVAVQGLMASPDWSHARAGLVGALLGLALLAKFSALLLLPCVFGALAWGALAGPPGARRHRLTSTVVAAATTVAVSGWHFARVWARFGDPFVGGWEARPGLGWWLDPGFRTLSHFTRFGRALERPAFAGLAGFWDGLYSTMWGDGMLSGLAGTSPLPPWWSPSLQAAGYLLASIPVTLLAIGLARVAFRFVRGPTPEDGLVLLVPLLVLGALAVMTVRVPAVAQDKAFYGLMALGPLAVILAEGMVFLAGKSPGRMVLLLGALGCWGVASFSTYWIDRTGTSTRIIEAVSILGSGDQRSGAAVLAAALRRDPGNWELRAALGTVLAEEGEARDAEVEALLLPGEAQPSLFSRQEAIATWAETRGRLDLARDAARRCIGLAPDAPVGWMVLGNVAERRGDVQGSIDAWREVLRITPGDARAHSTLARLYARVGNEPASRFHRSVAVR